MRAGDARDAIASRGSQGEHMSTRTNHQEIVKKALEAKAIDFGAIGKVVAKLAPSLAMAGELKR